MKTETVSTKPKSKRKPKLDPNQSNPDLLWKDLATEFIEEFILFFFGRRLFNAIDFSVKPEYLEQEFNEVFAANYPKKKVVDKIIKFQLKNGKMKFIILHTEFQGKAEKLFRVRMFEYFVHIFIKYKTSDVTALAIYTGPSRPQIYDRFHVSHYGTAVTYKFNTYTVRDQKEEALLASDNPFAFAVLASLYLIKAGTDAEKKLEYKKKLLNFANEKGFDHAKLHRMLNFVKYLVRLPQPLETIYQDYSNDSKKYQNPKKMEYTVDFLETHKPLFGKAMSQIEEKGMEKGIEKGRQEERKKIEAERKRSEAERKRSEAERKKTVLYFYVNLGFNVEEIINAVDIPIKFINKTISDYRKSLISKS